MAVTWFLALLLQSIIFFPKMVGEDELDRATQERMRQYEEMLTHEKYRLMNEVEQLEHSSTWSHGTCIRRSLFFCAFQHWQFWAIAGVLLLLLLGLRKSKSNVSSTSRRMQGSSGTDQSERQLHVEIERARFLRRQMVHLFTKRIQCHMENLAYGRWVAERLVCHLLRVHRDLSQNGFFPVLQPAIGIGSAFEGWCSSEDEVVFRMLMPLKPPHGHDFHLELGTDGKIPAKESRIHVNLKCTCNGKQLKEDDVCFIHNSKTKLTTNQAPSFLDTFCRDSYLDVQKIVHWFEDKLMIAWGALCQYDTQLCQYEIQVLTTQRSCMMKLTSTCWRHLFIEILFGVQQGNSNIFLSSQATDAIDTPSTVWPQSCAVAEAKFFKYMTRKFRHDNFHLRCLHICCRILKGTTISTYNVKTIVMHLLATGGTSHWHRDNIMNLLECIINRLHLCLLKKRIDHFFTGNNDVPKEIILPPDFQRTKPVNLLERLKNDQAAHTTALQELKLLQERLVFVIF